MSPQRTPESMCVVWTRTNDEPTACHEGGGPLSAGRAPFEAMPQRLPRHLPIGVALLVAAVLALLGIVFTRSQGTRLDGLEIQGTATFEQQVVAALTLLKTKSPGAYHLVTTHIGLIKQAPHTGMAAYATPPTFALNGRTAFYSVTWCAASIAHDAFHAKLYQDYLQQHPGQERVPDAVWTGEAAERRCVGHQRRVLQDLGAAGEELRWLRELTHRYWEVAYHQREW